MNNLTSVINWDYSNAQVLETPKQSGTPRPKVVVFLRPLFRSMVGRAENKRRENGIISPDFARFLAPGHQYVTGCQLPRKEQRTMANLTILSQEIRQLDGFYSLNDLHKASGGERKNTPSRFVRNDQTQALIKEIAQNPNMGLAIKTVHGGKNAGTYVCIELLLAYAMWINPIIHLHVLRAFLLMYQQPSLPAPRKKYSYPRRLLEQPGFSSGNNPVGLSPSMLANTRAFVSPLLSLLNELRADGHDVSAPWDEAIAMREAIINMDEELKDICYRALKASNKPASTQLKEAVRRKS